MLRRIFEVSSRQAVPAFKRERLKIDSAFAGLHKETIVDRESLQKFLLDS